MSVNDINQKSKMTGMNADVIKTVFQDLADKGYGKIKEGFAVNKNGKEMTHKPIVIFERITFAEFEAKTDLQDLPVKLNILKEFLKKLQSQKDMPGRNFFGFVDKF